ncbi:GntR family transcriptional regulator [Devosia sp. RR2S18]|uniref:GntR family transcriptional regulator n=1 Tax=Devosia rhizosphaerae TaxID=3049774 RepID=UPI002540D8DB|nr:FCD domain-containing protein [Devosia sp. RR2S18]WIJ27168.1 FCD domain-containing protein [Devosia sp. RR2S18]
MVVSVSRGEQPGETIGATAYRRLRRDIINGELLPGQRLRLENLRERYGVSVSTLREILSQLVSESFVVAEGQRGFEVSAATANDLKEVGDLRLLLENHALALSLKQGDLDWEAAVVAAFHKLSSIEQRLLNGETEHTPAWIACDFAFHQALISACNSRSMLTLHSSVFDRFLRYHMIAKSFRGAGVAKDHEALFQLALARDVEGAQRMLEGHVSKGIKHILATGTLT